jgi:hypothetical protein
VGCSSNSSSNNSSSSSSTNNRSTSAQHKPHFLPNRFPDLYLTCFTSIFMTPDGPSTACHTVCCGNTTVSGHCTASLHPT